MLGENDNNKINKLLETFENYSSISEKYKLISDFNILKQLPLDQYQKPGLKLITKSAAFDELKIKKLDLFQ